MADPKSIILKTIPIYENFEDRDEFVSVVDSQTISVLTEWSQLDWKSLEPRIRKKLPKKETSQDIPVIPNLVINGPVDPSYYFYVTPHTFTTPLASKMLLKEYCLLVGPRGCGKSTVAKDSVRYLQSKGEKCIYIDVAKIPTSDPTEFWGFLCGKIANELTRLKIPKPLEFKSRQDFLSLFSNMENFPNHKPVFLIIDEATALTANKQLFQEFLADIRSIKHVGEQASERPTASIAMVGPPSLIAACSPKVLDVHKIKEEDIDSPFNISSIIHVGSFNMGSLKLFGERICSLHGFEIDEEVLEHIHFLSGGHPSFVTFCFKWMLETNSAGRVNIQRWKETTTLPSFWSEFYSLPTVSRMRDFLTNPIYQSYITSLMVSDRSVHNDDDKNEPIQALYGAGLIKPIDHVWKFTSEMIYQVCLSPSFPQSSLSPWMVPDGQFSFERSLLEAVLRMDPVLLSIYDDNVDRIGGWKKNADLRRHASEQTNPTLVPSEIQYQRELLRILKPALPQPFSVFDLPVDPQSKIWKLKEKNKQYCDTAISNGFTKEDTLVELVAHAPQGSEINRDRNSVAGHWDKIKKYVEDGYTKINEAWLLHVTTRDINDQDLFKPEEKMHKKPIHYATIHQDKNWHNLNISFSTSSSLFSVSTLEKKVTRNGQLFDHKTFSRGRHFSTTKLQGRCVSFELKRRCLKSQIVSLVSKIKI